MFNKAADCPILLGTGTIAYLNIANSDFYHNVATDPDSVLIYNQLRANITNSRFYNPDVDYDLQLAINSNISYNWFGINDYLSRIYSPSSGIGPNYQLYLSVVSILNNWTGSSVYDIRTINTSSGTYNILAYLSLDGSYDPNLVNVLPYWAENFLFNWTSDDNPLDSTFANNTTTNTFNHLYDFNAILNNNIGYKHLFSIDGQSLGIILLNDNATTTTPSNTTVNNETSYVGDEVNLTATLTDQDGNPLANKTINFYIDGVYIGNAITDNNGVAKLPHTADSEGSYVIEARFEGDNLYEASNSTGTLLVSKIPTNTTVNNESSYVGDEVNLTAKLTDEDGNPLANKTIEFYIDGVKVGSAITDSNGVAKLPYTPKNHGMFKIDAKFLGDYRYVASDSIGHIVVSKKNDTNKTKPTSTIADDKNSKVNKTIYLTAKITDENGNPLANKTIDFYVDGVYVGSAITDSDGVAKLSYTPKSIGKFKIEAKFLGDKEHEPSSDIAILKVQEQINGDNNTSNKTNNNSVAGATMKKTGMPIITIILVLISLFGVILRRKD